MVKIIIIRLQQHLPFTVLKPVYGLYILTVAFMLQQHLPFTVLKHFTSNHNDIVASTVATAPTVYGIETHYDRHNDVYMEHCRCNSTYRLRY